MAPGRYSISPRNALTADERAWLVEHRERFAAALAPALPEQAYSRLEQFSFGFGQLRGVDPAAVQGAIVNWAEAVDGLPWVVVDRTCKLWNARKFKWQKPGLVPNPDEFAQAAAEVDKAIRAELAGFDRILGAELEQAPLALAPPAEGRPTNVADAVAELKAAVARAETPPTTDPQKDPAPAPARYSPGYLDALEARRARREAQADLTPPSRLRVLAEPNQGASA